MPHDICNRCLADVFDCPQAAWVLPLSAETEDKGSLANFLRTLGINVTEVDIDEETDDEAEGSVDDAAAQEVGAGVDSD